MGPWASFWSSILAKMIVLAMAELPQDTFGWYRLYGTHLNQGCRQAWDIGCNAPHDSVMPPATSPSPVNQTQRHQHFPHPCCSANGAAVVPRRPKGGSVGSWPERMGSGPLPCGALSTQPPPAPDKQPWAQTGPQLQTGRQWWLPVLRSCHQHWRPAGGCALARPWTVNQLCSGGSVQRRRQQVRPGKAVAKRFGLKGHIKLGLYYLLKVWQKDFPEIEV